MTIIIANPREGVLLADHFQVVSDKTFKGVSRVRINQADKIIVTEDRRFAYVFDLLVEEQDVAVILNYLTRYELKTLPKDEILTTTNTSYVGYFMTARGFYRVVCAESREHMLVNHLNYSACNNKDFDPIFTDMLGFTSHDMFEILSADSATNSGDYQVVKQSSLKRITKTARRSNVSD